MLGGDVGEVGAFRLRSLSSSMLWGCWWGVLIEGAGLGAGVAGCGIEVFLCSVSKLSFSSIVLNNALCVSKILVVSFALLFNWSMVLSILSIRKVTSPRAWATPVADAMASPLRVADFSLLSLIVSKRRWTFRGMLDSRRVLSFDLLDVRVLSSQTFFGVSLVDLPCWLIAGNSCVEKVAWVVLRACRFGGII